MSSAQDYDLYKPTRTGMYAAIFGMSVVIMLLVLFANEARSERYDNNGVMIASTEDKCVITKTSVFGDNVVDSTAKVGCKKTGVVNKKIRDIQKTKQKNVNTEFTVCLESEQYSQDCTNLELQHKMNTTKISVSDLCEGKPKILFKMKDSSETHEYEISCK